MIDANRGDSGWWCALDAKRLEASFLAPPASVSDAQLRAWIADYDARHGHSLEDEVGEIDALCPLVQGARRLDGRDAGIVLYLLCVDQCAVSAGFDLDTGGATSVPAWLRSAAASFAGYAGLLDPADVRALAGLGQAPPGKAFRDALEVVRKKIDCSQDVDDLALLVDAAVSFAPGGHWLLGVQSAT